ncbi:Putative uncharacterized protein [Lactobacillus equicursoris DSM 19284 = JCM 14600 = CIP 110162]|uniref:Membrane protein 6-pyruvoyl-tetrahydropterin synthase-related domain-containing protein n=1 Tax=Lactobacillus equicursoris DSM 19284 = JCM 14600 = CIP 110162 TaxID=1293597 RepID=K0NWQ9_9LACO|nr:hypothetical protein [Lactobacillus equicursoris]KRL02932.1 hypothetical protein FC20_GL001757 [Lactobacillus equicursoris DSM 19284 = JCM 14600 = CIP 110162]CCK86023.1 Putative uncharacterized protein [Lactobacillus equicursoris DSM 19284 = JCM 14600 = CIP 110162]
MNHQRLAKWLPYLFLTMMAMEFVFIQMRTGRLIIGSDSIFHFNQIYEAEQQIKNHNFSYFMSIYAFHQSGRVINAVYGPILTYLLGALLLAVKSWYRLQVITSFLVYLVAGCGMYWALKKAKVRPWIGALIATIYMTMGWVPRWQMGSNYSAITGMLAPYMLVVIIKMLEEKKLPWIGLAALMTISVESHLLTALLLSLLFLPFWLYGLRKSEEQKRFILDTAKAVAVTVILSLQVLLPLLLISKTNLLHMPQRMSLIANALHLAQPSRSIKTGLLIDSNTRDILSRWVLLFFLLQAAAAVILRKKQKFNLAITAYGLLLLFISSKLFPWQLFQTSFLSKDLQFPSRLVSIAYPLLLLGAGISAEYLIAWAKQHDEAMLQLLLVASLIFFTGSRVKMVNNQIYSNSGWGYMPGVKKSHTTFLGEDNDPDDFEIVQNTSHTDHPGYFIFEAQKIVPDYLAVKKKATTKKVNYSFFNSVVWKNQGVKKTVISGGRIKLTWTKRQAGKQQLPVVTYAQSSLTVNGKKVTNYKKSLVGCPTVLSKQGKNTAILSFNDPCWVKAGIALSLLLNILAAIWLIFGKRLASKVEFR